MSEAQGFVTDAATTTTQPGDPTATPAQDAAAIDNQDTAKVGGNQATTSTILDEDPKPNSEDKSAAGDDKPIEIKLPEDMAFDEESVKKFADFAKEKGIPGEVAQELFDLHASRVKEAAESSANLWLSLQKEWRESIQKDPEIGGGNFASMKATVGKALDQFGGKPVRDALALTGAGNNPEIVRMIYRMAKALTEGQHVPAGKPAGEPQDLAERIWPNLSTG